VRTRPNGPQKQKASGNSGEGEAGAPIIADITRSLYPFERNTVTGDYRPAVPKMITGLAASLQDAIFGTSEALSGEMSDIEMDPVTGEILPFNSRMTDWAQDTAGLVTGGEAIPSKAALATRGGRPVPRQVTRALEADKIPLDRVAEHVAKLGSDGMVADLGPNVRAVTAAAVSKPGAPATGMVDTLTARQAAGNERTRQGLNDALGEAPVPSSLQGDIRANKRALGPEYETALESAAPVDLSNLAAGLDEQIAQLRGPAQLALTDVRRMLNETGGANLDTSARVLFQTRQAIDGLAEGVNDPNVARVLRDARRQVNDILVEAAPGIQSVDSAYRELSRQSDAVDNGQTVLDSSRKAPRPAELAEQVQSGALPEGVLVGPSGEAFRLSQGARAEIDRVVGTNANDRAALERLLKGDGDWNRQRLATLFGPDRASRLFEILAAERAMAETEGAILRSAQDLAQAADLRGRPDMKMPGVVESALNLKFGTAAARLAQNTVGRVAEGVGRGTRQMSRDEIIRAVMGDGDWAAPTTPGRPSTGVLAPLSAQGAGRSASDDELMRVILRQ
jgi:hypothetical protein